MEKLKIGLAFTASCCCYEKALAAAQALSEKYSLTGIMSQAAASTDSRFGRAEDIQSALERISGKPLIKTIAQAEPIGPQRMFDVLVIAPCTGNTAAKLAAGITDSTVTMAAKSQLRAGAPVVLAFGSNDGLGAGAKNIGELLNRRSIYFVPFYQDDPDAKPRSLASDYSQLEQTILYAMRGQQHQPILCTKK